MSRDHGSFHPGKVEPGQQELVQACGDFYRRGYSTDTVTLFVPGVTVALFDGSMRRNLECTAGVNYREA